jgi:hypothetical protein
MVGRDGENSDEGEKQEEHSEERGRTSLKISLRSSQKSYM